MLLGVTLGVGYLAKASMMPLGLVCLLLTLVFAGTVRVRLRRLALSASGFLLVAAPLLTAVSLEHGKPTFSDVGRFTYLKHVNEMPYPNFQPVLGELKGRALHPPRRIHESPPVYEFAHPIGGTYPMAFDPGYWTSGLQPTVTLPGQLRAIATNLMAYFDIFVRSSGGFLAIAALLVLLSFPRPTRSGSMKPEIVLLLWALAALGMYSLVFVEGRYIAPFIILFWSAPLSLVALPNRQHFRSLLRFGATLLVAFIWINIGALNLEGFAGVTGFTPLSESGAQQNQFSAGHATDHVAVAEGVLANGLESGDEIGFIGYSFSAYA
jgi:hypothetical protein